MDGLERELEGRASVLRANLQSDGGRELAQRLDISVVPSFVVVDGEGGTVLRMNGIASVPVADIRRAIRAVEAQR